MGHRRGAPGCTKAKVKKTRAAPGAGEKKAEQEAEAPAAQVVGATSFVEDDDVDDDGVPWNGGLVPTPRARVARVIERVVMRPGVVRPRVVPPQLSGCLPELEISSDDEAASGSEEEGEKVVMRPGVVKPRADPPPPPGSDACV